MPAITRKGLMNLIINRTVFTYTPSDMAKELLKCVCCRRIKSLYSHTSEFRQQRLFMKAESKLNHDFDALSLLRTLKLMKLLTPILFDPM